jgi:hypothetical protein
MPRAALAAGAETMRKAAKGTTLQPSARRLTPTKLDMIKF